jgi:NADPH:quinone reductase
MKAAYYTRKGSPHAVLHVGDLPDPVAGPGDVRVRVHVSAVNPSDTKQRQGWGGQGAMPYPKIVPHNDGAGVIDQLGADVPRHRLGERVWVFEAQRDGRAFGTAADYVIVPAVNAIRLPDSASFDDGASMGVPGMTAHRLLIRDGDIRDKTILVQGGGGSVGHIAIQLARRAGAHVIATVGSERQAQIARDSGAHHVIDYKREDVVAEVRKFAGSETPIDHIVEVAFAQNLTIDAQLIRPSGAISTFMINEDPDAPLPTNLQLLMAKDISVHFTLVYAMPRAAHDEAAIALTDALATGALKPRIAHRFNLNAIADAHELLGTKDAGGKVLIDLV